MYIIKAKLNQSFVIKLQKSYGCGTYQKICGYQLHIPGTQNTKANSFSRNFNETIEQKLSTHLFLKISSMFGNPTLDLFASCINYQIHMYLSWKPGPKALATDAFSIKWNTGFYYIFLPFSMLGKVTAKRIWYNARIHKMFTHYTKNFTYKYS